jgi:hypothetical protein
MWYRTCVKCVCKTTRRQRPDLTFMSRCNVI